MRLSDSLLPEFDHEMQSTRRTLERVPEDKLAWRPHPKSYTLGQLATHLAHLPTWTAETLQRDSIDLASPESQQRPAEVTSRADLLERFDRHVAAARAALAAADDARMLASWSLKSGATTYFTMPKIAVLRSWVMNHSIHHRAQLSVYLRLNDVPVPALYGPSADEAGM